MKSIGKVMFTTGSMLALAIFLAIFLQKANILTDIFHKINTTADLLAAPIVMMLVGIGQMVWPNE